MNNVVTPDPKQPYTKPTLIKHKPLRDITAQTLSEGAMDG